MNMLKSAWKLFNGKKTVIASIYWGAIMPSLLVFFPQGTPPEIMKVVTVVGFFLTATGLGHIWYKKVEEENSIITKD
jgi:hypothetical protein